MRGLSRRGFLIGAGALYAIGWIGTRVFRKEAMGLGDVKLLGMMGTFIGPVNIGITIFLASCIGAVFGLARIGVNALLRRSGGWASSLLTAGPVSLDMTRQELKVNESAIELTSFEYKIIEYLMVRAGQVISKTELTERLYDQDFERDSNVIEVFIGRLRKKMDPDSTINPIETLRGRGYRFALERGPSG